VKTSAGYLFSNQKKECMKNLTKEQRVRDGLAKDGNVIVYKGKQIKDLDRTGLIEFGLDLFDKVEDMGVLKGSSGYCWVS